MESMIANLAANTGHDLDWWVDQALASGGSKHGEMMAHLKKQHRLTHGYANLVAIEARTRLAGGPTSGEDLITAQYKGKEHLIPIYQQLLGAGQAMGPDVEVSPKKASVSLRRSKQFALIEPATKTRIDVGLNLKGVPGATG